VFRSPPDDSASGKNEIAHDQPDKKSGGAYADRKQKHRRNHGEIVRSGVAAVRAAAPPCIQDAGHSHQDERNCPNGCSNRNRDKQTGNDRGLWTPPARSLVVGPRSQSRVLASVSMLIVVYPGQQEAAPLSPARSACIGGHGTEP
jgi:hypothetical protein